MVKNQIPCFNGRGLESSEGDFWQETILRHVGPSTDPTEVLQQKKQTLAFVGWPRSGNGADLGGKAGSCLALVGNCLWRHDIDIVVLTKVKMCGFCPSKVAPNPIIAAGSQWRYAKTVEDMWSIGLNLVASRIVHRAHRTAVFCVHMPFLEVSLKTTKMLVRKVDHLGAGGDVVVISNLNVKRS